MRPSKLRLPLSTAATTRFSFFTACRNRLGQRPAVADARGASVAHQMEPQLLEIRHQAGFDQIVRSLLSIRARGWSSPMASTSTPLDRFLCEQSGRHHDRRIRCVGAARDRRDHDGAVRSSRLAVDHLHRLLLPAPAESGPGNSSSTSGRLTRSCGRFGPAMRRHDGRQDPARACRRTADRASHRCGTGLVPCIASTSSTSSGGRLVKRR